MKPMLATDIDWKKAKFPLIQQPKIDGVRGWCPEGQLVGRSLKNFKNVNTTNLFNHPSLAGLDGELCALGPNDPRLCRTTTSALGTIKGAPHIVWWLFDLATPTTIDKGYTQRYQMLQDQMHQIWNNTETRHLAAHFNLVPCYTVTCMEEALERDAKFLVQGYEGSIFRRPGMPHKQGRSTTLECGLLRLKQFVEEDAVVTSVNQGNRNDNEATIGLLGQTERSSHQENMVPNGLVGSFECTEVKTGKPITVSAGKLTHTERKYWWDNRDKAVGRTLKFKKFLIGEKDLPRFPTFQDWRLGEDKVED